MTSTFHLGDFMVDGDIYQDRKYTGGGRTYLESGWMMEMSFFFFKHAIFEASGTYVFCPGAY